MVEFQIWGNSQIINKKRGKTMKFSTKTLIATLALSILMITPVFATEKDLTAEINAINKHVKSVEAAVGSYLKTDDGCGPAAKADHGLHADTVAKQVKALSAQEQANYINYLQAVVGNKLSDEAAAKQQVSSLTDIVKVNPGFQPQLDAAIVYYNNAVAARMDAEAAIGVAKAAFAAANAQTDAAVAAEKAYQTSIDK